MILLEYSNRILVDTLGYRLKSAEKQDALEMTIADFDGVVYHVSTDDSKTKLTVSLSMKCFHELVPLGVNDVLKRIYGPYVAPVENGYDFSLEFDLERPPKDVDDIVNKVALLKRNALGAAFERVFSDSEAGKEGPLIAIHYRDEEAIYLRSHADRVIVVFSTTFKDETDIIYGKVFLQEFVDARRQPQLQNAPQVKYLAREPPLELKDVRNLKDSPNIGYVTFVLTPRHYQKGQRREDTISLIQTFRDYLHYHIKCSKAYMHSRMRARVAEFLKILNRAKPEPINVEKKLASGKTFVRK